MLAPLLQGCSNHKECRVIWLGLRKDKIEFSISFQRCDEELRERLQASSVGDLRSGLEDKATSAYHSVSSTLSGLFCRHPHKTKAGICPLHLPEHTAITDSATVPLKITALDIYGQYG